MERMKWQPLRERVAREVHAIWRDGFNEETRAAETWDANEVFHDEFYADADRILAALGLGDLDAAVERMAGAMYEHDFGEAFVSTPFDGERAGPPVAYARQLLEAALTATKEPCLYPLPDGRRCCECDTCQAVGP